MKLTFPGKWSLVILPVYYLVLSISMIFIGNIKHYYINNIDPPYLYLMNGTNLASGHFSVGLIEPPGTPVEIFTAIVIFVKHLFSGNTLLYQDVLLHPESYLITCSVVLALLLAIVTFIAGNYVFRHSGNTGLAILFQSSPLFFCEIVRRTFSLDAESFITIYGVFFMAYLYINTIGHNQSSDRITTNKSVLLFGLFSALLITTKIYCCPVLVLVLFLVRKWKQRVIYMASSGVFTLILLFPLYNQLIWVAVWMKSILFHTGFYGNGAPGIIDPKFYKDSLIDILTVHFIFTSIFILVMVTLLVSLWRRLRKKAGYKFFLSPIAGVAIFFIIFILIIAKSYKVTITPPFSNHIVIIKKVYYFTLVFIYFPLALCVSYKTLSPVLSFEFFRHHKQKLFYGLLIILIAWGGEQTYADCYATINTDPTSYKTRQFLDNRKNTPLIMIVNAGNYLSVEPAIFLGAEYSGRGQIRYFNFLKKTHPNTYLYISWVNKLYFWDSITNISAILGKDKQALIYQSGADSITKATILLEICAEKIQKNKATFKKIYSSDNKYESIYLVKSDTAIHF